ncbi:hypothetical protein MAPG_05699 [Magnaporthiopsis poae ATCC 64411]|uniref:Uncharacterized protein n=1 Tax=Magnaporthiopsis poae (strain ATCC 64411 / 73-15) TaxID=644358 RepID=A0A0C4E033_MAGP6|nr:hypothetical protein MAPG_05699 [Magnaporthiopsis poae ATCC 64411]
MQAVPSIVGTSSVVAAAAVGLVFAQPSQTAQSRSSSPRRKLCSDLDSFRELPVTLSRPATSIAGSSTAASHSFSDSSKFPLSPTSANATRPSRSKPPSTHSTQLTPPKVASRRHSFARQREGTPSSISEDARDSASSNGSWMRRLSMRPLSQHGSVRSSVGQDSLSLNFSHASNTPALPPIPSSPPRQLPPNKLVKRTAPAGQPTPSGKLSRRGSRSQIPALRRPATSHQRSATLQQVQYQGSPHTALPHAQPKYSLDQQSRPATTTTTAQARPQLDIPEENLEKRRSWSSFFHLRVVRSSSRSSSSGRGSEASPGPGQLPARTLDARKGSAGMPRAYLVNASVMSGIDADAGRGGAASTQSPSVAPPAAPPATAAAAGGDLEKSQKAAGAETTLGDSATAEPNQAEQDAAGKTTRRSISMHFTSTSAWIARTGSLRRQKRGADGKSGGVRNVSAPVVGPVSPIEAQAGVKQDLQRLFAPPTLDKRQASSTMDVSAPAPPPASCRTMHTNAIATRQRNSSSPLPPLPRLSSFNVDLHRAGSSASSTAAPRRHDYQLQASPFPASLTGGSILCHSRDVSNERASTLAGSDLDMRSFMTGDDDDTDFKSDTMYESIRTGGSARVRNVDTPLESMFDESPPSTAGNSKTKRLSIQEILGRTWDADTKIMEEDDDENSATPVRHAGVTHRTPVDFRPAIVDVSGKQRFDYDDSAPALSLATRDFGRLSLDDDDDFDWARDDENALCNHLSPPNSSINSRGSLRLALASISGNGSPRSAATGTPSERPRSNVFDWTEPICPERMDADGPSPRPKTVHGKQELDSRNGRASNRKGPTATHVRSQSVPVVPDPPETTTTKSNPAKFRTWASGPKNVSEDWEEDFEFDEEPITLAEGDAAGNRFSMIVPASIQATQPTVKAHSGQIRELSLLVNGLKRLCRHGRDLDLLNESAELWKEAEDIIKLASPDEDEAAASGDAESANFDLPVVSERYTDEGFDAASLNYSEESFEVSEQPGMSKTAVVRERQVARRRSVFPPEDDIFGGWPSPEEHAKPATPQTPNRTRQTDTPDSAVIASVIEAMQQQQQQQQQQRRSSSAPVKGFPPKTHADSKLFFDTNSLQELVKQANVLFHVLSDIVRKAELITQSPAMTPKRERHLRRDGSPAFTRVFTDPTTAPPSPPKRLLKSSHSNSSVISGRPSAESRASTSGLGPRLHMMTVS